MGNVWWTCQPNKLPGKDNPMITYYRVTVETEYGVDIVTFNNYDNAIGCVKQEREFNPDADITIEEVTA